MSDNLRRYRAIRDALTQCYPGQPSGTVARHLITLAGLISGIVGSKSTQLPHIATKVPDGTKPESRVKRFARWCDNAHILEEVYFLPYADVLLRHLALQTVVLVMDGSGVGRGCTALMIHVVYKGRALPLAWRVRQAPKGHFPEELHIALVDLIRGLLPAGAQVVLLGDGEFDGTRLQHTLQQAGWSYACRTATSTVATWAGETFRLDALGSCLKPGRLIELKEVHCTREGAYLRVRGQGQAEQGLKASVDPGESEVQEMVETILTPAHPDSLEPLLNKPFTGTFDHPAAQRQSQVLVHGIVDVLAMPLQISISSSRKI